MKINVKQIIIKLLFLLPLGTIISNVPFIGNMVNKILYAIFILCLLYELIRSNLKKTDVLAIFLLAVMFIYDLVITGTKMYNSNEIFYLVTWVVYLIYVKANYDSFKLAICCELLYIKRIIILCEFIIMVSLFLSSSWSSTGAFYSFSGGQHRMDSAALMILVGVLFLYRYQNYRKSILFYAIIPSLAIILSGARTYLIVMGFVLAVFYYYTNIEHTYRFWITIIPIVLIGINVIMSTSIMQERMSIIQAESTYFSSRGYNALTAITSGRSIFWSIDLQKYWESPLINKILGNGFNFVRYVNDTYYTDAIWAHNDFINIICCNGIVGLYLYFYAYMQIVKRAVPSNMPKKKRWFMLISFHLICMVNAMFNMLYSYFAAAISVPILLFVMMDDTILGENKRKISRQNKE